MRTCLKMIFGLILVSFLTADLPAAEDGQEQWMSFRGVNSAGSSQSPVVFHDTDVLTKLWETEIPGSGHSTPVISDGTAFLTTSYISNQHRLWRLLLNWIAALSAAGLCVLAFVYMTFGNKKPSLLRTFVVSIVLWILLAFIMVGWHIFSCQNATYRIWILTATITAIFLVVLTELFNETRWVSYSVMASGIILSFLAMIYFPYWVLLLNKKTVFIVISALLLPSMISLVILFRLLLYRWPPAKLISALLYLFVPVTCGGFLFFMAVTCEESTHWDIQQTRELVFPQSFYYLLIIITLMLIAVAATGRLSAGICNRTYNRILPQLVIYGALLFVAGALAALPLLVNRYQYFKYHFVRGTLESEVGLLNSAYILGAVLMAPLVCALIPSRVHVSKHQSSVTHRQPWAQALALVLAVLSLGATYQKNLDLQKTGLLHAIVAVDVESGKVRWTSEGLSAPKSIANLFNSFATPSPAVDKGRVFAYFGATGAFMCDTSEGTVQWTNTQLPYQSSYGSASSLVCTDHAVVIQSDSDGLESYVAALAFSSGRLNWKKTREAVASWRTPLLFQWESQQMLCAWARKYADIYDAKSGELIKRVHGIDCGVVDPITSPVSDGKHLWFAGPARAIALSIEHLMTAELPDISLPEINDDGSETVVPSNSVTITPTAVISLDLGGPTCSTPALSEKYLVTVSDMGIVTCLSVAEMAVLWVVKTGEESFSSPLIIGDYVVVVSNKGVIRIFSLPRTSQGLGQPEPIWQTELEEDVKASPVACNGRLYIRTEQKLYCFAAERK